MNKALNQNAISSGLRETDSGSRQFLSQAFWRCDNLVQIKTMVYLFESFFKIEIN